MKQNVKLFLCSKDAINPTQAVRRFYIPDIYKMSPHYTHCKLCVEDVIIYDKTVDTSYIIESNLPQGNTYDSRVESSSRVIGTVLQVDGRTNVYSYSNHKLHPIEVNNPLGTEIDIAIRSVTASGISSDPVNKEYYIVINLEFPCSCE